MNITSALRYLDEHENLEANAGWTHGLSLDRMTRLCEVLGDPQHAYPVIHVTGTNGKGSTVRMIAELLRATGLSVGTFTSPHLERINERISWDGEPIPDQSLADQISTISELESLAGVTPSYFEILTAAALSWFAELAVDVAVVEVGLLGRFDATNVVDAKVAVLTNVGLDHTDGQGAWRAAIADEKSGIVKPGSTFVLGETDPELQSVFEAAGAESIWRRGADFDCDTNQVAFGGRLVDLRTPSRTFEEVFLPVHGAHQGDNAAIALAATEAFLGPGLDHELVADAYGGLKLPGRFEVISRDPTVVVDAAHNVDGAEAVAHTLAEEFTLSGSLVIVIGLLGGRDPIAVLEALGAAEAGFLIACTPNSPRAIPAPEVAAAADRIGVVAEAVPSVAAAVDRARAMATPDDLVLIVGSLYVVGPARTYLLANEVDA